MAAASLLSVRPGRAGKASEARAEQGHPSAAAGRGGGAFLPGGAGRTPVGGPSGAGSAAGAGGGGESGRCCCPGSVPRVTRNAKQRDSAESLRHARCTKQPNPTPQPHGSHARFVLCAAARWAELLRMRPHLCGWRHGAAPPRCSRVEGRCAGRTAVGDSFPAIV